MSDMIYIVMFRHANGAWLVYDQAQTLPVAQTLAKRAQRLQSRPVQIFVPFAEEETDG